ncbi:hypothetical protein [Planotetraspora silvatica]|uniref:hypothetical protein n=1 Tax=Planotetraspora silvatica TaxID=234614 RepID=UPI00195273F1|nr:hypothetical protein [Planotetraspora silvatica]
MPRTRADEVFGKSNAEIDRLVVRLGRHLELVGTRDRVRTSSTTCGPACTACMPY